MELEKSHAKINSMEEDLSENQRRSDLLGREKDEIEQIELKDQEIIKQLERKQLELLDESQYQREHIKQMEMKFNLMKTQHHQVFSNYSRIFN